MGHDGCERVPGIAVRGVGRQAGQRRCESHEPRLAQGVLWMIESAGAARFEDGYLTVRDGLKLHYRDYAGAANNPPLLCLHGLTRNARDWTEFAERYAPRFRVLVPEFRGRGASGYDPDPSRYNPLVYAGDLIELLDQLGIDQAIFAGTSLGGLVTMTIAAATPHRIAAAILNDIGPDV